MDKYEIRRRNLIKLKDQYCGGKISLLAERLGKNPSYVSRLLYEEGKKAKKNIADKVVTDIEKTFELPRGWLDGLTDLTLAQKIEAMRSQAGLSIMELSEKAGLTSSALLEVLSGKTENMEKVKRITQALGSDLVTLLSAGNQHNDDKGITANRLTVVKGSARLSDGGIFEIEPQPLGYVQLLSKDPDGYALLIKGDAMYPRFNSGEYIVMEPLVKAVPGDEVLIKTTDGVRMLRKLGAVRDNEYQFLSIDPKINPITIDIDKIEYMHVITGILSRSMYVEKI